MKKEKGFTLIELLAVIIILGVIMLIAIPSVTRRISDSRKNAYVDTAKEVVKGAVPIVNGGELDMYDTDTTYYIHVNNIPTENGLTSPYGDFKEAYIGVVYTGEGYQYYWISNDENKQGIKDITPVEDLDKTLIESNIEDLEIREKIETTGIGGRSKIKILDENGEWEDKDATNASNGITAGVEYPSGKDKSSVTVGDIVKIGSEEFYVVKHEGDNLVLLARYNLKVGDIVSVRLDNNPQNAYFGKIGSYNSNEEGFGMQSSEAIGYYSNNYEIGENSNGVLIFSETAYWKDKVGNNLQYPGSYSKPNYPYVYDNNSHLKQYVDSYATRLGVSIIEARLLKYSEAVELGCSEQTHSCSNAPSFVTGTTYWLGNAADDNSIWNISYQKYFDYGSRTIYFAMGIRPVIVI